MSLGPQISIVYHLPGIARKRTVVIEGNGSILGSNDARELGVVVRGNERVRRVEVNPTAAVAIDKIEATLFVAIGDADAIYLNGYNSWTDSVERPVNDRMWGLTRAPHRLVDKYVLDGSGDYRFVEEDPRRGHMHGFGYGYLRQGDEVLLFGSLNEDNGFTVIREDLGAGTLIFEKEPPVRPVARGERREVLSLAVCGGTLDEAVREWLLLANVKRMPAQPIVGYSSWYRHYDKIDGWNLSHDLEGAAAVLGGMDLRLADPVFQIDDGYAKVGDWLEYDCARFPEGMATLAQDAKQKGMIAGLWVAPFVCSRESRVYAEHQDWLLRDQAGKPVMTGDHWGGAFALDMRNEEARAYVRDVLRVVTREWGFELLKLDFLYGACMLPHDGLNRGQLMADALDFVRECVGEDVRLLFCGVPLVSAFGRCEYCRIGCDVGLDWDDKPHMRLLHRERVSTKNSLANARGRAHLDGRVFRCDPDVLFLREEGVSFTPEQYQEMLKTDTSCGGVLFTSDDMSSWNADQLDRFHNAVAAFLANNER